LANYRLCLATVSGTMTPSVVHAAYNTGRREHVMQIIDADGHVAETPSLAIEA